MEPVCTYIHICAVWPEPYMLTFIKYEMLWICDKGQCVVHYKLTSLLFLVIEDCMRLG